MRILLPALGLSAVGLPLVLLACTPKVRPDPLGSGGSGGAMSTTDSASSSGSTTGAGGSGGAAPMGICSKAGLPFTILGAAELDGTPQLDDKLYLIPDQENRAMVHVVVTDSGMNRVLVRTVTDAMNPLGKYTQYGAVGMPGFRPSGAQIVPGQLILRGTYGNDVAQLGFFIDPDQGVGVDGMLQTLPTPIECLQGGHPGKVVFAPGTSPPLYLVSCIPDAAGMPAALFAGDGGPMLTELASGPPSSPGMSPGLYTYESNTHLVIFGGDNKQGLFFGQGTTVSDVGTLQPIQLTPTPVTLQGVFAAVPLPKDDGVTLIAAFFDNTTGKGKFLAGPILANDYASLAKVPPPGLTPIQDIPLLADVAPIFFPTWDPTGIVGGGASTDGASARLYWFTRDGKPLVFGQSVYTNVNTTIVTANAASLGEVNKLVVWTEENTKTTPPTYTVNGQKLVCQIKG